MFGGALAINTEISAKISDLTFGLILVSTNLVVLVLIGVLSVRRYQETSSLTLRVLGTRELAIIDHVMRNEPSVFNDDDGAGLEMSDERTKEPQDGDSQQLLAKHEIRPQDVNLLERVGSGSFGEVFLGTLNGNKVAVKTIREVTDTTVRLFRQEILLHAELSHPNIVSFVGACWGERLTCLVLEWVPKGSLGALLEQKQLDLYWHEPLLKMTIDVARGMQYLHGRSIVHRDLKVWSYAY